MTLLKSSADRLFVEQLAEVNNKGNINVPHKRHFVGGIYRRQEFPYQDDI